MTLTRNFKETVRARAQRDPYFRLALIEEAVKRLIVGDHVGALVLRNDAKYLGKTHNIK